MEILWLAIVFYSLGLGLVLHFRPAVMFHENGTWKEFGYQRSSGEKSRHTMFPFWLFAVTWAFVSYAIAAAVSWSFPAMGLATATTGVATAASSFGSYSQNEYSDDSEEEEEEEVATPVSSYVEPVRRGRGRPRKTEEKKPRAGYYVMDPETREGGLRKYIYYGPERPEEEA
jgi:hypothetical protein